MGSYWISEVVLGNGSRATWQTGIITLRTDSLAKCVDQTRRPGEEGGVLRSLLITMMMLCREGLGVLRGTGVLDLGFWVFDGMEMRHAILAISFLTGDQESSW